MKKYLITTNFVYHYIIVCLKSYPYAFYDEVSDELMDTMKKECKLLYSNKTEEYCSEKNYDKIHSILGEDVMNNYDFQKLYERIEMIEIYDFN